MVYMGFRLSTLTKNIAISFDTNVNIKQHVQKFGYEFHFTCAGQKIAALHARHSEVHE